MGLLMELGPCNVQPDGNSTKVNPYAWNEKANMIFIDQPVGVGFSYADHSVHVDTTEQAAIDLHAFLVLFYEVGTSANVGEASSLSLC
jgi:carboxypeptidase C (cathepsin A)